MPGARNRNNGSLLSGGTNGYYWSSTVSGANANGTNSRRLSFSSSNAFMVGSYGYNTAEQIGTDRIAAIRRAIVRATAEIGRRMK